MGLGGFPARTRNRSACRACTAPTKPIRRCRTATCCSPLAPADDRVIGNPGHFFRDGRKIIHIDIDRRPSPKRVKVDVLPIVGYVRDVLDEMLAQTQGHRQAARCRCAENWWTRIKEWQGKNFAWRSNPKPDGADQAAGRRAGALEGDGGDAIITSDVGQHQMWAAQYYLFNKPRRWINSGGLGTMGVGIPYAMGAQLANPDATVACITGEGSVQMCIQELSTRKQYHIPMKIINLNNRSLGMVRQWQEFFYGNRYAESYMDALPDFVKLAEAYGHVGMKIERRVTSKAPCEAFKLKDRLVFMDFITDETENVFPMVPGGKGLTEMILAEEL